MTNEMWDNCINAMTPYQKTVANLELDTYVTVALKSGYTVSGEVSETSHPAILTLMRLVDKNKIRDFVYIEIAEVSCYHIPYV